MACPRHRSCSWNSGTIALRMYIVQTSPRVFDLVVDPAEGMLPSTSGRDVVLAAADSRLGVSLATADLW